MTGKEQLRAIPAIPAPEVPARSDPAANPAAIGCRAPIPDVRGTLIGRLSSTHLRPSCPRQRLVVSPRKRSFASDFWSFWRTGSCQFGEERLCVFQVGGVEALGEPGVDRGEEVVRLGVPALVAPQPGEARGGTQFP